MGNLSDSIIGSFQKYVAANVIPTKTDKFEYDTLTKTIKRLKPDEPYKDNFREWNEAKKQVMGLSPEYEQLLRKASGEGRVIRRDLNNGVEFSVEAKYSGFPVELYVIEDKKGEIRRAEYIAYNIQKNVVFIRDLRKVNSLSNF